MITVELLQTVVLNSCFLQMCVVNCRVVTEVINAVTAHSLFRVVFNVKDTNSPVPRGKLLRDYSEYYHSTACNVFSDNWRKDIICSFWKR